MSSCRPPVTGAARPERILTPAEVERRRRRYQREALRAEAGADIALLQQARDAARAAGRRAEVAEHQVQELRGQLADAQAALLRAMEMASAPPPPPPRPRPAPRSDLGAREWAAVVKVADAMRQQAEALVAELKAENFRLRRLLEAAHSALRRQRQARAA